MAQAAQAVAQAAAAAGGHDAQNRAGTHFLSLAAGGHDAVQNRTENRAGA